jgi:hypothetical protein
MTYRKLRIAWSIAWGAHCLLVVTLWVRSYWWQNWFQWTFANGSQIDCVSASGLMQLGYGPDPFSSSEHWFFEDNRVGDESEPGVVEHEHPGGAVGI